MEVESFDDWLNKADGVQEKKLTGTSANAYADKKGIDVKIKPGMPPSELSNGGPIDSDMIDVIADLEKATGMNFKITSGNDKFHQNITSYKSNHTTGMAIDITSPELSKSRGKRKELETAIINLVISGKYNKNGNRLGGINEYDKGTKLSTGGHFHLSITPATTKRDGREFSFPLTGFNSYADIRDKVKTGDPIDVSDSPSSTNSGKKWKSNKAKRKKRKYYYKVYDKANSRFLTAKYKGDMFKVYDRKRKKVGEVFLKGEKIIMNDTDISETPVGIGFRKLFKIAARGGILPTQNGKEGVITINTKGKIKHSYSGAQATNISLIEQAAIKQGVVNPQALIGILSVIGKESQFIPKSEKPYSGTDNNRIRSIFKTKLGHMSDDELTALKANDEAFFNAVYGGRYGNGPDEGYKYRGRGFNQITFKGTYEKYSKLLGKDLVGNPDLLNDPKIAAEAAVAFLLNRFKGKNIDPNTLASADDAVIKFAGANAGWGKDPSRAIANAKKIQPNFSIA
jgi:predicted chitinase